MTYWAKKNVMEAYLKGLCVSSWYFLTLLTESEKKRYAEQVRLWVKGVSSGDVPEPNFTKLKKRSERFNSERLLRERLVVATEAWLQVQGSPFDLNFPLPEAIRNASFLQSRKKQ